MSGVRALWLPYQVEDLDSAQAFYTANLNLSQVDSWHRSGERGVVLAAGASYLELVAPAGGASRAGGRVPAAFEVADAPAVDECFARWSPVDPIAVPHRYPRGHYGFELRGPAGAHVMVWSER